MAAAFGFSVSDFIDGIRLVADLIGALRDAQGSSSEFLELNSQLYGLEQALMLAKSLKFFASETAQFTALHFAIDRCRATIDAFIESITKYQPYLRLNGSSNSYKNVVRKVQWRLLKREDIGRFRAVIGFHLHSIQALTQNIQAGRTYLQIQNLESQSSDISTLQARFTALDTTLSDRVTTGVDTLQENVQAILTQSIASAQHLQRLEQSLNGGPLWQAPVCFVDAFDKCYAIHLELISSYEDLNDLLIIKFRHAGHEMIRRREFVLREHKTNTFLNFDRPWKFFFSPRQTVVMSMVFLPKYEGMPSTEVCTMCNTNFTCHNGIHTCFPYEARISHLVYDFSLIRV